MSSECNVCEYILSSESRVYSICVASMQGESCMCIVNVVRKWGLKPSGVKFPLFSLMPIPIILLSHIKAYKEFPKHS